MNNAEYIRLMKRQREIARMKEQEIKDALELEQEQEQDEAKEQEPEQEPENVPDDKGGAADAVTD